MTPREPIRRGPDTVEVPGRASGRKRGARRDLGRIDRTRPEHQDGPVTVRKPKGSA